MVKFNHAPEGSSSVVDNDLLTIHVACSSNLPWVLALIEELQFLRDEYRSRQPERNDFLETVEEIEYISYLKSVLDKLGAKYHDE